MNLHAELVRCPVCQGATEIVFRGFHDDRYGHFIPRP